MSDNEGSSSQQQLNSKDFTPKELQEIESLKQTMNNRGSSTMEKQIAEAKLDVVLKSKQKPPHNHHPRVLPSEVEDGPASNIFRDDLTFEKYEMGNEGKKQKGSKESNMTNAEVHSVKFNHKARGATKEAIGKDMAKEQMEDIHL